MIPVTIVTYTTRHLLYKDKVRFFYALKGRGKQEGIITRCQIKQLGKTVLMLKPRFEKDVVSFLKEWKCAFQIIHAQVTDSEYHGLR